MTITGAAACAQARKYLGQPYVFGGNPYGPPGTLHSDCSGLIDRVQADLGTEFPGRPTTFVLVGMGVPIGSLAEALPGDWLFFEDYGSGPNHVAIYLGGNQLIEDPHTGANIHITDVYATPSEIRRYWADAPTPAPKPPPAPAPEDDDMTPDQTTAANLLALRQFFGSSEGQGRIEQGDIAAIVHQHLSVTKDGAVLAPTVTGGLELTRTYLLDLAERAGKTFLAAFLGVVIPLLIASQANVGVFSTLQFWESAATAGTGAGIAAVVSLITSVLSGFRTGTASLSRSVAQSAVVLRRDSDDVYRPDHSAAAGTTPSSTTGIIMEPVK